MLIKVCISMTMRGGALFGKFILVLFIAKYFKLEDVGLYGLFTAAIIFGIYLLGFDFYTYSVREMAVTNGAELGWRLKSHFAWLLCCYSIFLPVFSIVFLLDLLPEKFVVWFYLILVLEHMTTELARLLIIYEKQMVAAFSIFVRNGLWAGVCVLFMYVSDVYRTLDFVFLFWVLGLVLALIVSFIFLKRDGYLVMSGGVKWRWITSGLRICVPLLLATLSIKAIFTLDRYMLGYISDHWVVGIYVFYMSMAAVVIAMLEQGVFNFYYPSLIKSWRAGDINAYREKSRAIKRMFFACVGPVLVTVALMVNLAVGLIGRPEYVDNIKVFYWSLISAFLFTWSMVYYYDLYAQNKDRYIILIRTSGFIIFVVFFALLGEVGPLYRTLYSVCAASFWLLLSSYIVICAKGGGHEG